MGRAGGGGSSGGGASGGGHSHGTSGGGHSFGGGGRAGMGGGRAGMGGGSRGPGGRGPGDRGPGGGPRMGGPGYMPPRRTYVGGPGYMGGPRRGGFYGGGGGGFFGGIRSFALFIVILVLLAILFVPIFGAQDSVSSASSEDTSSIPASTVSREKLTDVAAFDYDCVTDELGYVTDLSEAESNLKNFYDKTGVQPYVYFKSYDSSLTTDEEKEQYAIDWYDENIGTDNGFLFVYFANEDENSSIPDSEKSVGYMAYACGSSATAVMDSEAISIFWGYIDRYWTSDLSTEDMLAKVYDGTADSIMSVTTTTQQMILTVVIVVAVIVAVLLVIWLIKTKRKAEAERAKETQDILNTPLDDLSDKEDGSGGGGSSNSARDDETVSKYL
ncbi:MAG: hypothetical protein ACOYJL_05035 [Tractidigestivibacter sp.]|jgi:uncharacterized membrane protein|uniref:hypothetical protein n=1 Tax=Tractidigestivibacter sp. TaxID=2847320 RepID=UPI003D91EDEB